MNTSRSPRLGPVRPATRRRRSTKRRTVGLTLVAAVTAALAGWSPTTASAATPVVVEEGEFDNTFAVPADQFECDVDVVVHIAGIFRVTEFLDRDGKLSRVRSHTNATTRITSEHGTIVDRWVENVTFDAGDLTRTFTGNIYNVHSGAGGILVNDSGRLVFDETTGEPIIVNGPHQGFAGDFADACAALEDH